MTTQTAELEKKKNGTSTAVTALQKDITDQVMNKIKMLEANGGLDLPPNYSVGNALKSAWLIINQTKDKNDKPALNVCTRESIANSLLDMIIQALNPSKKQCYFVVYGNQLALMRSYFGTVSVTKRLKGVKDAFARVVYKDDVFEYHFDPLTNKIIIDKHEQKFSNIDNSKIVGAYAVVVLDDDSLDISEPMTIEQIKNAWSQGATKGNSPAHKNFPEEMSKKTVLNRKCKMYFNTSDDSNLLVEAANRTTENEYIPETPYEEEIENEIEENANKELLDVAVETEQPVEESTTDEVDWESPISIVAAIEKIKTTDDLNEFNKKNKKRLSVFDGKEKATIEKALKEKEDEVLRGF